MKLQFKQRIFISFLFIFLSISLSSCLIHTSEKIKIDRKNNSEISRANELTVICEVTNYGIPPRRNLNVIYYDDNYLFMERHYGNAHDSLGNTEPGFFVHSKKIDKWLIIKKITTQKSVLGYTKELTKEESKKMMYCPVYIGQSHLTNYDYCNLPLKTSGSIAFPDKIILDENLNEYVLEFFNSWGIEKVRTILRFKKEDIDSAFSTKFK